MAIMGRPKKEIDFDLLEKLCQIHCTAREISHIFECSEDTLERRISEKYGITFAEYYQQKQAVGKAAIRRKMFEKAQKGDNTMLIWLSKNHLHMADKVESKEEVKVESKTEITYTAEWGGPLTTEK